MAAEGFIGRWSRLKRRAEVPSIPPVAPEDCAIPADASSHDAYSEYRHDGGSAASTGRPARSPSTGTVVAATPGVAEADPDRVQRVDLDESRPAGQDGRGRQALPSIDSLGKDSDFAAFMRPEVDPVLRVSALKKLFTDPHFNRMDGLDTYIDDYSKPDPMPLAFIRRLAQSRILGLSEEAAQDDAACSDATSPSPDGGATPTPVSEATPSPTGEETPSPVADAIPTPVGEAASVDVNVPASVDEIIREPLGHASAGPPPDVAPAGLNALPASPQEASHPERVA